MEETSIDLSQHRETIAEKFHLRSWLCWFVGARVSLLKPLLDWFLHTDPLHKSPVSCSSHTNSSCDKTWTEPAKNKLPRWIEWMEGWRGAAVRMRQTQPGTRRRFSRMWVLRRVPTQSSRNLGSRDSASDNQGNKQH